MTSLPLLKKEKATSVKSLIHFVIFTVSNPKPTPTPTPTPLFLFLNKQYFTNVFCCCCGILVRQPGI